MTLFIFTLKRQCIHQNQMIPIKIRCCSGKGGRRHVLWPWLRKHDRSPVGRCSPRVPGSYRKDVSPESPALALKVESRLPVYVCVRDRERKKERKGKLTSCVHYYCVYILVRMSDCMLEYVKNNLLEHFLLIKYNINRMGWSDTEL